MSSNNPNGNNIEDPQPPYNHSSTPSILHHSAKTTISLLPTTLFLTLLLFSFHSFVETGTVFVISAFDTDPSLRSLFLRLSLSPTSTSTTTSPTPSSFLSHPRRRNNHRHRPFLHLTRVGTLDDDFFSSDDRSLFGPHSTPAPNSTFLSLSNLSPALVRPGLSFGFADDSPNSTDVKDDHDVIDSKFLGLELGRGDLATLFFFISVLSAAYGWVILGFVITYSWALGIVFVAVVNDLLETHNSFTRSVWNGSNLGVRRLSRFILVRWAVRDAVAQIVGHWFFGQIHDLFSFCKLFLRMKLMPFSVASPWVPGYDKEISGFLFAWFMIDTVVSFVLGVASWVMIVNTRRGGREIVKEGCYLLATMTHQSIQLKCLELISCGAFMRWVLARVFGRSLAIMLQSFVEVYFMVAWLIFYFAARCKDASLSGRRFGKRELDSLMEGLR